MIQPTYAQQPIPQTGGANAVAINILNPQAFGAPQQAQPYGYTNSLYQMPSVSAYAPQGPEAGYFQQYVPQQVHQGIDSMYMTQPPMMPQMPVYQPMAVAPVYAPQPQVIPDSVIEPQDASVSAEQAPVVAQDKPESAPVQVDVDSLVQDLSSADAAVKAAAIDKIAELVQDPSHDVALQVVSEPVMSSLVNIINEDTSALEGKTKEQEEVATKIANQVQLTPEEEAIAENLSPKDAANKNKVFAMYTLAMLDKMQRDNLAEYAQAQTDNGQKSIETKPLKELKGFAEMENIIKNGTEPELQIAAMQALQYMMEPQDTAKVQEILSVAQNSANEGVKAAATEVLNMIAGAQQEQPATEAEQAPQQQAA